MKGDDAKPWRVNEQTPSTIITPWGRISISWEDNTLPQVRKNAELVAAKLVRLWNSKPTPKPEERP